MERLEIHLGECATCRELSNELDVRATKVAAWMESLPEPGVITRPPLLPSSQPSLWRWAGASLAVSAAAVAMAIWLTPRNPEMTVAAPRPPQPPAIQPAAPPAQVKPAIIRRPPVKRATPPKPKPQPQYYIALDDQPIEAGIVVRVGFDNGRIPADVILGPDGRARAIRLISDFSGER